MSSQEGTLTVLTWTSVNAFLVYCKRNVLGPASGYSNVAGGLVGRGPSALYGQSSGMAFARNKGPPIGSSGMRESISNEQMGVFMVKTEQRKHPEESIESITKRLFQ